MKCLAILFVALVSTLSPTWVVYGADASQVAGDGIDLLKRSFSDLLKVNQNSKDIEIEYCPDNTCDVFKAKAGQEKVAGDYAYIHLFYVGAWENDSFKKFKTEASGPAAEILGRNIGSCENGKKSTAKCVLQSMEKKFKLKMVSRTYDEAEVCDTQYAIDDLINHTTPKKPPQSKCTSVSITAKKWGKSVQPIKK